MNKLLLKSLHRIVAEDRPMGQNFLKSGNILNKIRALGVDAAIEIADASYERTAKEKEVSEKGYLLGRANIPRKTIYRIDFPPNILFFIGNEADVLRKIEQYSTGEDVTEKTETEKTETEKTEKTNEKVTDTY